MKNKQKREKNAKFTILLQQILSSKLLHAVIDNNKIILVMDSNRKQEAT